MANIGPDNTFSNKSMKNGLRRKLRIQVADPMHSKYLNILFPVAAKIKHGVFLWMQCRENQKFKKSDCVILAKCRSVEGIKLNSGRLKKIAENT